MNVSKTHNIAKKALRLKYMFPSLFQLRALRQDAPELGQFRLDSGV